MLSKKKPALEAAVGGRWEQHSRSGGGATIRDGNHVSILIFVGGFSFCLCKSEEEKEAPKRRGNWTKTIRDTLLRRPPVEEGSG